jgi:hypothetical protein
MNSIYLFYFALCIPFVLSLDPGVTYSAVYDVNTKSWSITRGIAKDWYAWGKYEATINETGWNVLDVVTNHNKEDDLQAYAAGLIEVRFLTLTRYKANYIFYCSHFSLLKDGFLQ